MRVVTKIQVGGKPGGNYMASLNSGHGEHEHGDEHEEEESRS